MIRPVVQAMLFGSHIVLKIVESLGLHVVWLLDVILDTVEKPKVTRLYYLDFIIRVLIFICNTKIS